MVYLGLQLLPLGGILLAILAVNWLLFRRMLFHAFDPAWILILHTSLTMTLVGYEVLVTGGMQWSVAAYIGGAQLAFVASAYAVTMHLRRRAGLRARAGRRARTAEAAPESAGAAQAGGLAEHQAQFLRQFLRIGTVFLLAAFAVRAYSMGLAIFSDDPEAARVMASRGGFGLVTRVISPLVYVNLLLLFYALAARSPRLRFTRGELLAYFGVPAVVVFLSSGKSGFLVFFVAFFFANAYLAIRSGRLLRFVSLRAVALTLAAVLVVSLMTLSLRGRAEGGGGLDTAGDALVGRVIYAGLALLYYYERGVDAAIQYAPTDYVRDYVVVPFLAPLRIVNYQEQTLGLKIGYLMTGSEVFGPNPTMYLEGWAYFGWLGVLYCGALGALFAWLRWGALDPALRGLRGHGGVFDFRGPQGEILRLLAFGIGNAIAVNISVDMLLVDSDIFNFLLIVPAMVWVCHRLTAAAPARRVRTGAPRAGIGTADGPRSRPGQAGAS